jgi:hypothetical protein
MEETANPTRKADAAHRCGRGMVNFLKLFSHGVIELPTRARVALRAAYGWLSRCARFRVFAGTLNRHKLMHHLATVLGLCRRAAEIECLGAFTKNKAPTKRTATAASALRFLWDYLGWTGGKRSVALGLVGPLHTEFRTYREAAERMCRQFDSRFPYANL